MFEIINNFNKMSWWEAATLFYAFLIWVISTLKFIQLTIKSWKKRG